MEPNWAADNLQVIRTLMERTALYRRALAPVMLLAGTIGVVAAAGGLALHLDTLRAFVGYWLAVSLVPGLGAVLIVATFIDLDHMVIPDAFTIWLGAAGIVLSFAVPSLHGRQDDLFLVASVRSGLDGISGLLVGSGLVLWIALLAEAVLKKEAMGFGDVKFVGAIGAFAGWPGAMFAVFMCQPFRMKLHAQKKRHLPRRFRLQLHRLDNSVAAACCRHQRPRRFQYRLMMGTVYTQHARFANFGE